VRTEVVTPWHCTWAQWGADGIYEVFVKLSDQCVVELHSMLGQLALFISTGQLDKYFFCVFVQSHHAGQHRLQLPRREPPALS
jgi:hypothetical protein